MIEEKLKEIPYIDKLMAIKGVGLFTVSGFIAEVGEIKRFDDPKQLQKLAGYAIIANESGKHKGESRISYRGRKRLRYVLYEAALFLVGRNPEFRRIYEYYKTRKDNPLKKMQALIAVACKVIRVFYVILKKAWIMIQRRGWEIFACRNFRQHKGQEQEPDNRILSESYHG